MTRKKFRSMHKATRVLRRRRPPLPKEGKTGDQPYPRVNPPPQRKTTVARLKEREIAVTRRSGPYHTEVPLNEGTTSSGRKKTPSTTSKDPRKNERFSDAGE